MSLAVFLSQSGYFPGICQEWLRKPTEIFSQVSCFLTAIQSELLEGYPLPLVRSEALTAVTMKIAVLWDVTSCSLVDRYQGFGDLPIAILLAYSSILQMVSTGFPETLVTLSKYRASHLRRQNFAVSIFKVP
jgi:hypothetical protein